MHHQGEVVQGEFANMLVELHKLLEENLCVCVCVCDVDVGDVIIAKRAGVDLALLGQ